jgi:hypothetical protein
MAKACIAYFAEYVDLYKKLIPDLSPTDWDGDGISSRRQS